MIDDIDFHKVVKRLTEILFRNIRWFTRSVIFLVLALIIFHKLYPPSIEWIGHSFSFAEPSLAAILALLVLVFILERVVIIESIVTHPLITSFETREKAYKHLAQFIQKRGARNVKMLQFSGQTALPILREIAESSPYSNIRLLICHPEASVAFDTDGHPSHAERIHATIEQINILEEDYRRQKFKVKILYYRTPAALSSVVIDENIVSLGWYNCFTDQKTNLLRLRGHNAAAINAQDNEAEELISYANGMFEKLWVYAEPL